MNRSADLCSGSSENDLSFKLPPEARTGFSMSMRAFGKHAEDVLDVHYFDGYELLYFLQEGHDIGRRIRPVQKRALPRSCVKHAGDSILPIEQ